MLTLQYAIIEIFSDNLIFVCPIMPRLHSLAIDAARAFSLFLYCDAGRRTDSSLFVDR
jgi:hypothetical protein